MALIGLQHLSNEAFPGVGAIALQLGGKIPDEVQTASFDFEGELADVGAAFVKVAKVKDKFVVLTERPTIENTTASFSYYVVTEADQPAAPYLGYEP